MIKHIYKHWSVFKIWINVNKTDTVEGNKYHWHSEVFRWIEICFRRILQYRVAKNWRTWKCIQEIIKWKHNGHSARELFGLDSFLQWNSLSINLFNFWEWNICLVMGKLHFIVKLELVLGCFVLHQSILFLSFLCSIFNI